MQECGLNYPEIIKRFLTRPPSPVSAEWIVRLKEIVFYNLFIYLFNIIEILIKKIILFFLIYEWKRSSLRTPTIKWNGPF